MKKTYSKLLAFIACLLCGMNASAAYQYLVDGIYYNDLESGVSVSVTWGDEDYTGDIVIPATIEVDGTTLVVAKVGDYAFNRYNELTSVVVG